VLAGLRFSSAVPLRDSTHSPLIKFLKTLGDAAVAIAVPPWDLRHSPVIDRDDDSMIFRNPEIQVSSPAEIKQPTPTFAREQPVG
jgi:hypothetical protein